MRRITLLLVMVATGAVLYAAVGQGFELGDLRGLFRPTQRLPALRGSDLPFRYPVHLWRQGIEGEVLLRVHITPSGAVDSVELKRSSGYPELDSMALHGATELRYHPARQGERPVAVWADLPVLFEGRSDVPESEEGG